MDILLNLCRDERGFIVTIELLLIVTILVIGLVAGLAVLREAINSELNDVGRSIRALNQSYQLRPAVRPRSDIPDYNYAPESNVQKPDNCVEVFGFNDR